jgi:hypothetical protein
MPIFRMVTPGTRLAEMMMQRRTRTEAGELGLVSDGRRQRTGWVAAGHGSERTRETRSERDGDVRAWDGSVASATLSCGEETPVKGGSMTGR